jgi:2-C-methyl-D-erythritol 4-phosphate cytidylyltransferase
MKQFVTQRVPNIVWFGIDLLVSSTPAERVCVCVHCYWHHQIGALLQFASNLNTFERGFLENSSL